MRQEDFNEFKSTLLGIGEVYDKAISKALGDLWWNMFQDVSIEDFKRAVHLHMRDPDNGQFMPKPANLIKQITGTSKEQHQTLHSKAEIAWNCVIGEIQRTGSYGSPKLDDGLALAAIKGMGGWVSLCMMTEDQLVWARKEFISAYQNYSTTPVELLPSSLPGRVQIENAKKQGNGEGMKFIGDLIKRIEK